jgi:hypothetical protein
LKYLIFFIVGISFWEGHPLDKLGTPDNKLIGKCITGTPHKCVGIAPSFNSLEGFALINKKGMVCKIS